MKSVVSIDYSSWTIAYLKRFVPDFLPGKQFAASNALTVHLRTHSGERPYACDLCSKRFSRQETLTIHKTRKHSNDKAHACTICQQKFSTTEDLTEHLKSQHGDRYYHMCPSCGKVFASMQSLKVWCRVCSSRVCCCCCDVALKSIYLYSRTIRKFT